MLIRVGRQILWKDYDNNSWRRVDEHETCINQKMTGIKMRAGLIFGALNLIASITHSIYVPNDVDKKTLNTLGIKTLGWQSGSERVVVHHNYSKVHNAGFSRQSPIPQPPTTFDEEETTISDVTETDQLPEFDQTTTERIKWQRINDQLTELAGQNFETDQKTEDQSEAEQEWQTLGSTAQNRPQQPEHRALLKTVSDHLTRFDQSTQDFNPQLEGQLDRPNLWGQSHGSIDDQLDRKIQGHDDTQLSSFGGHHNQRWSNSGQTKINDQLSGFDQQVQGSNFDRENTRHINDQSSGFDQQVQGSNLGLELTRPSNDQLSGFGGHHNQRWSSSGRTKINDHLSGFDQQVQGSNFDRENTGHINDQSSGFDQQVQGSNLGLEITRPSNDQLSGFEGHHNQRWSNSGQTKINDHLSGFDQQVQGSTFDSETTSGSNLDLKITRPINDQLSSFEHHHNQEAQWSNLRREGEGHINDQLSAFGGHHNQHWSNLGKTQVNNQLASFDQQAQSHNLGSNDQPNYNNDQSHFIRHHVSYYDGRQFTNAHSAGQQPIRSEKLVSKYYHNQPIAYKKCPKHATGQYAYELSCNQFLNCWKGRGYVQNCAPGTLFNPKTSECDFCEKVECISGPRRTPLENREPLSSALQATCPQDFTGIIPHYTDCSKFINCVNGVEFAMSCPPGTLFDVRSNLCDHAYKVECANQTLGPGFNIRSSPCDDAHKDECSNQESTRDSRFHSGFANKYIVVKPYREGGANSTYQRQYLTRGEASWDQRGRRPLDINDHLDEFVRQIGYDRAEAPTQFQSQSLDSSASTQFGAANQNYSGTVNQYGGTSQAHNHLGVGRDVSGGRANQQGQFVGGANQYGQFEGGANKFGDGSSQFQANTSTGHTHNVRFDAIGGTANQQGQFVGGANQFGDGSSQFQTGTSTGHTHNVRLYDLQKDIGLNGSYCKSRQGVSEHPTNCSLFLYCDRGNLMIFPCEVGSFFNPKTQACDLNYRCKPRASQDYVSISRPKCPSNYVGLMPHPTICAKFLNCNNGQTFVQDCGPGTVFNPNLKACDYPYRVQCVDRAVPTPSQEYQTGQPKCPAHETGLFPHPTNCSKFLNCANGQTYIQECGRGTVFNPNFKICDYPHKVNCGVKAIGPEDEGGVVNHSQNSNRYNQSVGENHGSRDQLGAASQNQNWGWSHGRYNQTKLHGRVGQVQNQNLTRNYDQSLDGSQGQSGTMNQNWGWSQGRYNQTRNYDQNLYGSQDQLGTVNQNWGWGQGLYNHTRNYDQNFHGSQDQSGTVNQNWGWGQGRYNHTRNYDQNFHGSQDQSGTVNQNWGWSQGRYNQTNLHGWVGQDQNQNLTRNYDQNLHGSQGQLGTVNQNWGWSQDQNRHNRTQLYGGRGQIQKQWTDLNGGASHSNGASRNRNWWQTMRQNQSSHWPNQKWHIQREHFGSKPPPSTDRTNQGAKPNLIDPSSKHSPPPFPSTDTNADYVFEYDDGEEVEVPDRKRKNFCQIDDFRCNDTTCIPQSMVCDTHKDCPDGKDEINCEKYVEQFSLLSGTKMAVREKAKFPNVTLTLCAKYCMESKGFQCKAFNYRKNDGMCFIFDTNVGLSGSLFMLANYDYYEYRKFTVDCTAKHKCANQKCIDLDQVCDGVNDCGDRGDEKGCKAEQLGYSVRLVGSGKGHEGVVEVSAFGRSGYICDDMFGLRDAHVLCKELGFPLGALEVHGNSDFAPRAKPNETFYMMDDVTCLGNETSLRDCDFAGWGVHNCMEQEIIGVVCKTPQEKCPKDYWRCETGNECLPLAFVCDAVDDCEDKSDEGSQYCEAPIELRLVGGRSRLEGRVEIKFHGTWGTICDDDFNEDAAKVVCKYLGYKGSARVKKDGFFGEGAGPIWLDQIYCQGNETAIQECLHWDWGEHNCEHSEDVGVVCSDFGDTVFIEAQRHAKLPETDLLPRARFPERCGYTSNDMFLENDEVHFRVVKGSTARKGDYPWQASLRVKGKTKPTHWCGAVVVSAQFVLTAAHCLDGFTKGAYVVVAGDYNVDVDEGSEQVAYIEDFYTHEQFRNGTRMNNDIALIKLKGDGFNLTKEVQPICLPDPDFNDEKGMNCTISGFGSVQTGKAVASKDLRAGWIPIQARDVCKMPHIYGNAVTDGMICAGFLDEGVDACDGDSGGPLACLHNGLYTLIGITSWGQHCGYANKPGVYVRIAHYRKWIDNAMEKHS